MDIQTIYHSLRQARCCRSGYEFSEKFLGKTKSYYSVLKARDMEPSLEALLNLEYRIGNLASNLRESDDCYLQVAAGRLAKIEQDVVGYRRELCRQNIRLASKMP